MSLALLMRHPVCTVYVFYIIDGSSLRVGKQGGAFCKEGALTSTDVGPRAQAPDLVSCYSLPSNRRSRRRLSLLHPRSKKVNLKSPKAKLNSQFYFSTLISISFLQFFSNSSFSQRFSLSFAIFSLLFF